MQRTQMFSAAAHERAAANGDSDFHEAPAGLPPSDGATGYRARAPQQNAEPAQRFQAPARPRNDAVNLVERIKAKLPLAEYLGRYTTLKRPTTASRGDLVGKCCFHEDEGPSMHVNPDKGVYHCKGCGASGNVVQAYALLNDLSWDDAKKQLGRELGVYSEESVSGPEQLLAHTANRYAAQLARKADAMRYLVEVRGLRPETIERFGIGFCWGREHERDSADQKAMAIKAGLLREATERGPEKSHMAGRITFPVRDRRGAVVGFGGRTVPSDTYKSYGPKYMNSPETAYFHKSDLLYGAYEASQGVHKEGFALVVEGYMDVAVLHQEGLANAVALMGASASEACFKKLWEMTKRVVFCLDPDAAGASGTRKAIMTAAPTMPDGAEIRVMSLPGGLDPDEYVLQVGASEVRELCKRSMPLSEFLLREISEKCDLTTAEGRAAMVAQAREVAARFEQAPILAEQIILKARSLATAKVVEMALGAATLREDVTKQEIMGAMRLMQCHPGGRAVLDKLIAEALQGKSLAPTLPQAQAAGRQVKQQEQLPGVEAAAQAVDAAHAQVQATAPAPAPRRMSPR